jgi:hypothetical protein
VRYRVHRALIYPTSAASSLPPPLGPRDRVPENGGKVLVLMGGEVLVLIGGEVLIPIGGS